MNDFNLETLCTAHKNKKAWVVFTNQTDLITLRLLKKGFRHCFILIKEEKNWISIDPLAGYMEVTTHDIPIDYDLPNWLREQGSRVIDAKMSAPNKTIAPPMAMTCVEVCKRILGIHNIFVFTPWQLFKHLTKQPKTHKHSIFREGEIKWEA